MTLIIGIFIRDNHNKKEIFFASDGLAVTYKDNKKIAQREDVEKIRKLTPKICMGYTGKNGELFKDVFDELKNRTPQKLKKELEPFVETLREVILNMLETKKHKEIEKELTQRNKVNNRFIVGGVFDGKLILVRACSDKNYAGSVYEAAPIPDIEPYVAGATDEIQKETWDILKKKLGRGQSNDEIEKIIRDAISEIAERYPKEINNHIFIRRLSRNFDRNDKKDIN